MKTTVTMPGLRWAVEEGSDSNGRCYNGSAWLADNSQVAVVYLVVYFGGKKAALEGIRRRVLGLYNDDPDATLANELGEVIPPGG